MNNYGGVCCTKFGRCKMAGNVICDQCENENEFVPDPDYKKQFFFTKEELNQIWCALPNSVLKVRIEKILEEWNA